MTNEYKLQYFTKRHKIFSYLKDQCGKVCENEFDEATLSYLLSDFEFGLVYAKKQFQMFESRNIKHYIIGGFLLYKKFVTINPKLVKYSVQLVCSDKNLGGKLMNAFEKHIYVKDTIAIIMLSAIDDAYKFYVELGYEVTNIIEIPNRKIKSREMLKTLYFNE